MQVIASYSSDGSGTTKAFTNSMEAFSKTWTLGTGKSVKWPAGVGAKGNSGVAGVIQNTPGAIGYVNQSYIKGMLRLLHFKTYLVNSLPLILNQAR